MKKKRKYANFMGVRERERNGLAKVKSDVRLAGEGVRVAKRGGSANTNAGSNGNTRSALHEAVSVLPVHAHRSEIQKCVRESRAVIVVGETGSGKTTQIPQFLYQDGWTENGKMVAVTQPRRVAAITVSRRVAEEMSVKLGEEVGYTIRFDDCSSSKTKIKYMTDGMLVRESMMDADLSKYSVIVLDEAHERTLSTDLIFGIVKKILRKRMDLRVIVMSATLDVELFTAFLTLKEEANEGVDKNKSVGVRKVPPAIRVKGRQFPVDIFYSCEAQKDYLDAVLVTIVQIHLDSSSRSADEGGGEEEDGNGLGMDAGDQVGAPGEVVKQGGFLGDILVFLTGQEEIESMQLLLEDHARKLPPTAAKLIVCPIYAALPPEKQLEAFAPAPSGCRKVILATNIAETSITVNGVRYVIDPGLVKQRNFNPRNGMESLQVAEISQAQAWQRAGRAGREAPGQCYRLYQEKSFLELSPTTVPEIRRINLTTVVLQLKTLGIDDVMSFDFLQAPSKASLQKALERLYAVGALNEQGKLTRDGKLMAAFPLDPLFTLLVLKSVPLGCSEEALIIVSMLSVENIFFAPRMRREAANAAHRRFASADGDLVTLLNVHRAYMGVGKDERRQWCMDNFINGRAMRMVLKVQQQLTEVFERSFPSHGVQSCGDQREVLIRCIASGLFLNTVIRQPGIREGGKSGFKSVSTGEVVNIHPSSVVFGRNPPPRCVVYCEMVYTSKLYIRGVTPVNLSWMPEIAPNLFQKKN